MAHPLIADLVKAATQKDFDYFAALGLQAVRPIVEAKAEGKMAT